MKYTVSDEGAQALVAMAQSASEAVDCICEKTVSVREAKEEYREILGPHEASLDGALSSIYENIKLSEEPVNVIAEKMMEVAEAYLDIVGNDRMKGNMDSENRLSDRSQSFSSAHSEHVITGGPDAGLSYSSPTSVSPVGKELKEDSLKPSRSTPRDLTLSQYGFSKNASGMEVYDSPLEVDKYLYSKQGSAYDNFKGTCGLCSCANILRLAGVNYGEKEMIDYAANRKGVFFAERLCTFNPFSPSASGGTTPKQRQQILDHFGVSSSIWNIKTDADGKASDETIRDMAKWISEGRGVIVDVDAGLFYNNPKNNGQGHAVTLTSVERNKYGDITGFYILDSNQGTVKYNSWELKDMLRTFVGINVTSQIIR